MIKFKAEVTKIFVIVLFSILFLNKFNCLFYKAERNILSKISIKEVSDYELFENKNMKLYYTKNDIEYINLIKIIVDTYYPLLLKDFEIQCPKPTFILYPDKSSFCNAVKVDKDNIPMGVFYGGVIHIISPMCWIDENNEANCKDIFLKQGPIIHELTHYLLDMKTNGNYDIWFTEGMALYYEYKYTGYEWQKNLKNEASKITLQQLKKDFYNLDEALAYRKSFDIINEMVENKGEKALQSVCKTLH